jgi:3-oxoacyl-[acyl-carrier protein] reductase
MTDRQPVVLVLGASSDIGREVIREIDDGASLILAHYNRSLDKLTQLQAEVRSTIIPIQADLSREHDVEAMLTRIADVCPYPQKIVHLPAPPMAYTRFKDANWQTFQHEMDIELRSIVMVLSRFLPLMAKDGVGKIVFVLSSVCSGVPPKALAHYTTTKYALLGLMKALAAEYADKHVSINAVSPSMTDTAFLSELPLKLVELSAAAHPLKRNASTKDIAPIIKFLLSPAADYICGANIPVTGGGVF